MWNFQDTFETRKWSFIRAFSVCKTVPSSIVSEVTVWKTLNKYFICWKSNCPENRDKILICLLNRVPCVPAWKRDQRVNVLAWQCSLCANVPKTCQRLIFMCQRANKRANVLYSLPMLQLRAPMCQRTCQFFKHFSYEMLKEFLCFINI